MKKLLRRIIAFRNRVLRRLFVLFRSKISGTRVKLGTRVVFNQKTIITGKQDQENFHVLTYLLK